MDEEILYYACAKFDFKRGIRCNSFNEILYRLENDKKQIVFLDDLNYLLKKNEYGGISDKDKNKFMTILEGIKGDPDKILIVTLNDMHRLDHSMVDRIEVKINFDPPSDSQKTDFLKKNYGKILTPTQIKYIGQNSIGYNFRDLPELIKMAYRFNYQKVTKDNLRKALKEYRPTQLYGFQVENGIKTRFKDVYGKPTILKTLNRVIRLNRDEGLSSNLGLHRYNQMLFHGPAGTGKSFMVRAFAGEIGYPLICINGNDIHHDPFSTIKNVTNIAKRYKNCIVFIDEAEKLFGNNQMDDDNFLVGEFSREMEGSSGDYIKAIFILAVNNITRFGAAFQDRFMMIPFSYPTFNERLSFCQMKCSKVRPQMKRDIDYEYLAQRAKGKSYRELERAWNEIFFSSLEGKDIDRTAINEILQEKRSTDAMFG